MATQQKSLCEQCGGQTQFCFFATPHNPNVQPDIMVITEYPVVNMLDERIKYQYVIQDYGVDPSRIVWTSIVKCFGGDKRSNKTKTICKNWLREEITYFRPKTIITFGNEVLKNFPLNVTETEAIKSVKQFDFTPDVSPKARAGRPYEADATPFTAWLLHLYDLWAVSREPEKALDNERQLGKLQDVLNGAYPKHSMSDKNYYILTKPDELAYFKDRYGPHDYMSFDIETGGTDPRTSLAVGLDTFNPATYLLSIQSAVFPGEAILLDATVLPEESIIEWLTYCSTKKLIAQNGKFDFNWIEPRYKVNLFPAFYFDTMLGDYLLREWDKRHGLKFISGLYLPEFEGYDDPINRWFTDNKISKEKRDHGLLPKSLLHPYGCMDADVTLQLFYLLIKQLGEEGFTELMFEQQMPMQDAYAWMEHFGWGIDVNYWGQLRKELTERKTKYIGILEKHELFRRWSLQKEAELRATGRAFWHEGTQEAYTDQQCLQMASPTNRFKRKAGAKMGPQIKSRTYTPEDIEPDPTNDNFKRDVLYGANFFALKPPSRTQKTDIPQVNAESLRTLLNASKDAVTTEVITALLDLEQVNKWLSTYVTPVYDYVKDGKNVGGWVRGDGLVHCVYMLAGHDWGSAFTEGGTVSGRVSSADPNMTNIPSRRGGGIIKKMFIPIPRDVYGNVLPVEVWLTEEWVIIQLDFSQLELRVLADQSGDPFMVNAYNNAEDLHTNLAVSHFDKPLSWFTERLDDENHAEHDMAYNYRLCAKTSWFSVIYGSAAAKLQGILAEQGVVISVQEAEDIIYFLLNRLPQVDRLKREIESQGEVIRTRFGRRRWVRNVHSVDNKARSKAERQKFNFSIQSEGSDIASRGIIKATQWLRNEKKVNGIRAYPMGAVHDSFLLAAPLSELDYIAWNIRHQMETPSLPWDFKVPLKVDVEYGPNWGTLRKWNYA